MALELVGGAAVGAAFGEFLSDVLRVKDNGVMFKPKLEELEATLEELAPVIQEIEELNRRLNGPDFQRETESIMKLMEDGKKLVWKCSKIGRWNFLKRSRYQEKLVELDNKLLRFHSLQMQAHIARDLKHTLLAVQHISFTVDLHLRHGGQVKNYTEVLVIKILTSFENTLCILSNGAAGADPASVALAGLNDGIACAMLLLNKLRSLESACSSRSDQNALRISEYDETKESSLCEGGNSRHSIERLALPPLPADQETTIVEKHNSSSTNGSGKHKNESPKPLHILEPIAAKLNLLSPAIIMLICCFNLIMTFLILMCK